MNILKNIWKILIFISFIICIIVGIWLFFHFPGDQDIKDDVDGSIVFMKLSDAEKNSEGIRLLNDGKFEQAIKTLDEEISKTGDPSVRSLLLIYKGRAKRMNIRYMFSPVDMAAGSDIDKTELFMAREAIGRIRNPEQLEVRLKLGMEFIERGLPGAELAKEEFKKNLDYLKTKKYNGYYIPLNEVFLANCYSIRSEKGQAIPLLRKIENDINGKKYNLTRENELYLRSLVYNGYVVMKEYSLSKPGLEKLIKLVPFDSFQYVVCNIYLAWANLSEGNENKGLAYLQDAVSSMKRRIGKDGSENFILMGRLFYSMIKENAKINMPGSDNELLLRNIEEKINASDFNGGIKDMEELLKDIKTAIRK